MQSGLNKDPKQNQTGVAADSTDKKLAEANKEKEFGQDDSKKPKNAQAETDIQEGSQTTTATATAVAMSSHELNAIPAFLQVPALHLFVVILVVSRTHPPMGTEIISSL